MDAALMAVVTLATPADGPIDRASLLREIWASGVLTRLSAERELAGSVQRTVMDLLTRRGVDINSGEATFRVGAVRALRDVGNALVMVPRSQLNDRGGASR